MYISQKELLKNNIDLTIEDLENNLVQLGHEVEAVESYGNDKVVVGLVEKVEKHPEADRLNVCSVNVGSSENLQIVCGAPNVAENQLVPVALVGAKFGDFKIKKAKLRGVVSAGMICSLAELGLDKSVLTDSDTDGIHVYEKAEIGQDAFVALTLADEVLELALTANRGDCQSYIGVVRDLKALNGEQFSQSIKTGLDTAFKTEITVVNADESSKLLSAVEIKDVKAVPSPMWLKIFLAKHKIKTQNVLVDLTNYVLLQTGIPMHAYDGDKITNGLKLARLTKGEKFVALDETEYELKANDLVIMDDEKVVSLAAVMGSNETKITKDTKNILLEVGVFDPVGVRKSATSLGKKTDASMRAEKGIDAKLVDYAINLFVTELTKIMPAKISNVVKSNEVNTKVKNVSLRFVDVNRILGIDINPIDVTSILTNLSFTVVSVNDEEISVNVPTWRFDIHNDHDLIEEVIRIVGMQKVEVAQKLDTFVTKTKIINDQKIKIERELENLGLDSGLNQVITYSLVNENSLAEFNKNPEQKVELMMPLSKEHAVYRQSIVPSLMKVCEYNFARQQKTVNIFEIANTYRLIDDELIEEYYISGLVAGVKNDYFSNEKTNYDFYDAKAAVEQILNYYNIDFKIVKQNQVIAELNPYAHAEVIVNDEVIGFVGKTHPNYYPKLKADVYVFELNLKMIEAMLEKNLVYKQVSTKPTIERDLTITTNVDIDYASITSVLDDVKYLVDIQLKDVYAGEKMQDNQKATTFKLIFADDNETLQGEVIDLEFEKIYKLADAKGFIIKR